MIEEKVVIKRLLAERIDKISGELNIPKITVERVIRAYLTDLEEALIDGETITVDNLISIRVIERKDGTRGLRGRVSPAIKKKVKEGGKNEVKE